jgi:hypothetical protein
LITFTIAVAPAAQFTALAEYIGADETGTEKVQLCPPTVMTKLAVPLEFGIPVIVYDNDPAPLANTPAASAAVKLTIPVEDTLCAL